MRNFTVLMLCFCLVACVAQPFVPPPECDGQASLILQQIADPAGLDKGLLMVNLVAMEKIDGYAPQSAIEVLNQVEDMLNQGQPTYAEVAGFILAKLEIANALAGGLIFIVGDDLMALTEPLPISACDIALVRAHLAKQRMLVTLYSGGKK